MIAEQKLMQRVGQRFQALRVRRIVNFELITNARSQLNGTQSWVQHNGDIRVGGQLLQQTAI